VIEMDSVLQGNIRIGKMELVNYRNLTDQEKEMIRMWRNHEAIRKWMYTDHTISAEEHKRFFEKALGDTFNFYWLLKNEDNDYLGIISLNRISFRNRNAYFAIYSNPYTKMHGVGQLLVRCVIEIAFKIAKLHTLKLEVIEDNVRGVNLYRKMGFQIEGRLKDFVLKDGIWKDAIVMGMLGNNAVLG
jgi:UDP-4-amino-4,6-dideoxy-N-acetyl-beta-L-altrosamine N-acetyltransferase